jgi:hypothetical protein
VRAIDPSLSSQTGHLHHSQALPHSKIGSPPDCPDHVHAHFHFFIRIKTNDVMELSTTISPVFSSRCDILKVEGNKLGKLALFVTKSYEYLFAGRVSM